MTEIVRKNRRIYEGRPRRRLKEIVVLASGVTEISKLCYGQIFQEDKGGVEIVVKMYITRKYSKKIQNII